MTGRPAPSLGDPAGDELPPVRRVAFVLGLASGGMARHVAALAAGCRAAGLDVCVLGPEPTLTRLRADADMLAIPIGDRPDPARDAAAVVSSSR